VRSIYDGLDETWQARCSRLNEALSRAAVPVRVAGLATVWTVLYATPARYNWMFQFYLRREGLMLSWVGSGRMIFSLNFTDADFDEVVRRFVAAAIRMRDDGWWWHDGRTTNRDIRRRVLREMFQRRFGSGA
jgi:glutamate-1-semialdehyde 2,1-aminomutase